ncbi:hypothetical protein Tco_0847347 [Tanacetum coccineum]
MKSGDAGVKNGILTPGGERKRRNHRISEIRKKSSDNIGAARWLANLPRPVGHSSHVAMHASMHSRMLPLLPLLAQACDSGHAAIVAAAWR